MAQYTWRNGQAYEGEREDTSVPAGGSTRTHVTPPVTLSESTKGRVPKKTAEKFAEHDERR